MISRRSFARAMSAALAGGTCGAQSAATFAHGVASGDPLSDRVILWTRVSPRVDEEVIPVEWLIAEDPGLARVRQRGLTYTNAAFDYTVKVDVTRLAAGTTYYYQFSSRGATSPVGRTRTLPLGAVDRIRMAVTSCANYPYGYFNAYRLIANRADLDCVLHLGDYIYEYGNAQYGDGTVLGRIPSPDREAVTLLDYRLRYAQYRSDPDLQEVHRQHPFIVVYDDHETANNAWREGAQNHQAEFEGDWSVRRAAALQAWSEWLPVRDNPFQDNEIYRAFRFGDLLDLIMLDTRLAGRNRQVAAQDPAVSDPARSLLGVEQEEWFFRQLTSSKARGTLWRAVGQQVMMAQFRNIDGSLVNADQWDGYAASRNRFLEHLATGIDNAVVLSGDIHSSWGNEIAVNPFLPGGYGSQAVEFVAPGVTSPALEDRALAVLAQSQIRASHPHVKYVDLYRRGYLLLDVDRERVQGEWYHVQTLAERRAAEDFSRALRCSAGEARLVAGEQSAGRTGAVPLAP